MRTKRVEQDTTQMARGQKLVKNTSKITRTKSIVQESQKWGKLFNILMKLKDYKMKTSTPVDLIQCKVAFLSTFFGALV